MIEEEEKATLAELQKLEVGIEQDTKIRTRYSIIYAFGCLCLYEATLAELNKGIRIYLYESVYVIIKQMIHSYM